MLKRILKIISGDFLGKKFFQPFFQKLLFLSLKGMNVGGALVSETGEAWVLKKLSLSLWKNREAIVVFDVGANKGEYALLAGKIFKANGVKAALHAFEPSLSAYQSLTNNLSGSRSVIPYNFGFGSEEKQVTLYSDSLGSGLASVYNRDLSAFHIELNRQETISLKTLDKFCAEKQIQKIDFLKLDVEGNELEVLKGAKNLLEKGAVEILQFEFGGASIDARVFLRDFVNLLKNQFVIYRILKDGLWPLEYSEWSEVFVTTNFLAVNKNLANWL